jgi:uncharacterized membrane protein (UPF0127 family)
MHLTNATTGAIVAARARKAMRWRERVIGFLMERNIDAQAAIWFPNCRTIHTIGMRQAIDVLFLDEHDRVVRVVCRLPRNRPLVTCIRAHSVVELAPGMLERNDVLLGDRICLQ